MTRSAQRGLGQQTPPRHDASDESRLPVLCLVRAASRLFGGSTPGRLAPEAPAEGEEGRTLAAAEQERLRALVGPLFDPDYYLARYPDVKASGADPWAHYLAYGAGEGRDPHPLFRGRWYMEQLAEDERTQVLPLVHYVSEGAAAGLDPSPLFATAWYLANNGDVAATGVNPLAHYVQNGDREGRQPCDLFAPDWYRKAHDDVAGSGLGALEHYLTRGAAAGLQPCREVEPAAYRRAHPEVDGSGWTLLEHAAIHRDAHAQARAAVEPLVVGSSAWTTAFPQLVPLSTFCVPHAPRRLNVLVDSLDSGQVLGGVATSLILAAQWAGRCNRQLRIVTRETAADAAGFHALMAAQRMGEGLDVEFASIPVSCPQRSLDVSSEDMFLATSWWSAWSCLQTLHPRRLVYIVQEDERLFYSGGDMHLRCQETMSRPDIRVVVNTERLHRHLAADGVLRPGGRHTWFEPCFPEHLFHPETRRSRRRRRRLGFYSRPRHARNLYFRVHEVLNEAIRAGVVDPAAWELHAFGGVQAHVELAEGVRPVYHDDLSWQAYAKLVRSLDVGFSLMYTPHPSYPPLDLAASGAVVLTNTFGSKTDLVAYSRNIIAVEPAVEALLAGLGRALALATDASQVRRNYAAQRIGRDWAAALAPTLAALAAED